MQGRRPPLSSLAGRDLGSPQASAELTCRQTCCPKQITSHQCDDSAHLCDSLAVRVAADGEVGIHWNINVHQSGQLLQDGLGLQSRHSAGCALAERATTQQRYGGDETPAGLLACLHSMQCSHQGNIQMPRCEIPTCRMISNAYRRWISRSSLNACKW